MNRRAFVRRSAAGAAGLSLARVAAAQEATDMADGIPVVANYYQEFDADFSLDVPAEGYGGWMKGEIEISAEHTAVAVMHAWDCGTFEEHPGVWRSCDYVPRSAEIARTVFPRMLSAVRRSPLPLFHVVGGGNYYQDLPAYKRTVELVGEPPPAPERVEGDPILQRLHQFRSQRVWRGTHNNADREKLSDTIDFLPEAKPLEGEGIAEDTPQLLALCKESGINHLIYAGFAIDACLLMSPGGMIDMSRHGVMCSAIRQAVTAVENKETARTEMAKEIGLWRVAVMYGFVFDVDDLVAALTT